jgi:secreted trypsin-like serine protease
MWCLISPTVVLTAAHCTDGTATAYAYFQVEVPDDFRENPTGLLGTTYTPPSYNPRTLDSDVGAVVLEKAAHLSQYPVLAPEGFLSDLRRRTRFRTTRSWLSATASWMGGRRRTFRTTRTAGIPRPPTRG